MRQSTLKLTVAILLCSLAIGANAQFRKINVVTSAVPFLRISPDARAGGMGDLGIATSPDANSSFWNLAKTPFATTPIGIGLTYTPWLKELGLNDVYLATLGGYYKLDDKSALSASLRYFSLGTIQFTDGLGQDLKVGRPREFSFDMGYSRKLSDKLGVGVALRYINSNLDANVGTGSNYKSGSTVSGDLSIFWNGKTEEAGGWALGATLTNLGGKIAYTSDTKSRDYIPADLGLGATYTKVFDENNKITFGVDIHKLMVPTPPVDSAGNFASQEQLDKYRSQSVPGSWIKSFGDAPDGFKEELREFQASIGAEYTYNNQFSFRTGYFWEDRTKGNRKFFTMGVGVKYNVFNLNISYLFPSGSGVNRNPLSNTLRFTLAFDIDNQAGGN
jgi:Type IX secretion system protein PorV